MLRHFTLEYWIDEDWYVGRLKEVPGVFSQGETLEELEENIRDAYRLMTESEDSYRAVAQTKEIEIEV
ncbi:MAG: type II toxin-antitoxin system HicB family antitoxin [archaeon]|nr:type II toxin-antitoxin system HicB family antitoxin [archaeon]MDI6885582.1 type II toxin-antitoxin system HicB family antitoxin [archaeon]